MEVNRSNKRKRFFDLIALLVLALGVWITIRELYLNPLKLTSSEVRFTIATIEKFSSPTDGAEDVDFSYTVNGKEYKGFFNAHNKGVKKGQRYFVKFLVSDPSINEFFFDRLVSLSLIHI